MSLPRKTENSVRYARLATRGALTRLAMVFDSQPKKLFTGRDVTEILIRAAASVGSPGRQEFRTDVHTMIYLCDIDGTIADISHRLHFIKQDPQDWHSFFAACGDDRPIREVIHVIQALAVPRPHIAHRALKPYAHNRIVIITGRSDEIREQTEEWLRRNGVPYSHLLMRKAGDHREDSVVKGELLDQFLTNPEHSHERSHIAGVFEDRQQVVDMYRDRGLRVFQVDKGNF